MNNPAAKYTDTLDDKLAYLRYWIKLQYDYRTDEIEQNRGRIDWIDPGTRVSFTEVWAKAEDLGIKMNVVEFRLWLGKSS